MEPWKEAVKRMEREFSEEEKDLFINARPENILKDILEMEEKQRRSSRTRQISDRVKPLLDAIEDYGKALDVLANSSSVLPPLWGSLRVLLTTAQKFNDYYASLLDMLGRIADVLPRYSTYARLLQFHAPLQDALRNAHVQMITFFARARSIFRKSPIRMLLQSTKRSFEKDFEDCISQTRRYRDLVEAEAKTASIILQVQETERAEEERRRAEYGRKQLERLESLAEEHARGEAKTWLRARKCTEEKALLEECRLDGTCEWILERDEVSDWTQSPETQVLWLHGPPGCGKSYLYGKLLKYLEGSQPVLYFLFCGGDRERVTTSSLLRAWCLQLLEFTPRGWESLQRIKKTHNNTVATDKEITDLFKLLLERAPTAYLTLDALDECADGDQLLRSISDIPKRFKVLITSRTPANIRRDLAKLRLPLLTLEVRPELSKGDIERFIEKALDNAYFPYGADTMFRIRNRLTACDGMFLWVKLMIEHLESQTCEFEILRCLENLPEGLPETYDRILERINLLSSSRRMLAYKVFLLALTLRRPVSVAEMRVLLAVQPSSESFDDRRLLPEADSTLITVCAGMIQLRGPEKKIYFTHFTVTEYLKQHVLEGEVLAEIVACYESRELRSNESLVTAICVRYLCYDFVGNLPAPHSFQEATTLVSQGDQRMSLLSYAVSHWFAHLIKLDELEDIVVKLSLQFLDRRRPNVDVFWHLYWFFNSEALESQICPGNFSGLHVAAYFGLSVLVPLFLPQSGEHMLDGSGRSPLWWAAARGHVGATRLLLEARFDPDTCDQYSIAPVHIAANNGHVGIFETIGSYRSKLPFSAKDFSTCITDSEGWTPLHWAASRGQLSVVMEIITKQPFNRKYGTIFDTCNSGRTAFHIAALNGCHAVLGKLHSLTPGSLPGFDRSSLKPVLNSQDTQGCTALHLACLQGHQRAVEELLALGADVNITDNSGKTAADRAISMGHQDIFSLLTSAARFAGTLDIRRVGESIANHDIEPFTHIFHDRDLEQLPKLNSRDTQTTSTITTVINGHKTNLKLLVWKGRKWWSADNRGRTTLHHSAILGYDEITREILQFIKVERNEEPGLKSRHPLSRTDLEDFVNRKDDRGWTALHYSVACNFPRICKLLVLNGASTEILDDASLTPYELAMRENHRAIIEALARYAPLPSSRIALTFGWNAVHVGARDATLSEDDIASLAIEELLAKDRYGRTPLYRATEMGHLHIVEAIVHKTGISTEEALELATLSEEDGSNIELVHFFVSKLSPGCLLSDPSQQVPAQHLLTKMIKRNDVRAVAALCDAAVDLTGCRDFSASDPYSETALCVAINAGAVDVAIMLIDRGADISAIDHKGESMLYLASEKLLAPVVEKLLQHGADPNRGASQGHSPLRATMERLRWWDWTGVFPVARHLLDHGALLLSPTPFENCPAWIAIFYASHFGGPDYERFPMIKELLEKYGCGMLTDPPEKDKPSDNRFQPIHRAVASGDVAKLRDILDTGVPADWPTFSWSEKKTPLEMAVELKDFEAAKLLIDYGADVTSIVDPESDAGGRGDLGAKRTDERRELVQRLLEASQVF